jgi:hypothetical protein
MQRKFRRYIPLNQPTVSVNPPVSDDKFSLNPEVRKNYLKTRIAIMNQKNAQLSSFMKVIEEPQDNTKSK